VLEPTSISDSARDRLSADLSAAPVNSPDGAARGGAPDSVTPMMEYELYVPLHHNDGRPVDPEKLRDLKKRLVDEFGGLTHLRQENDGFWKIGEHTFRDRIEILRVLANENDHVREYFADLKEHLKREWNQRHFLIVSRQVTAV
jgi:inorganic pyrophosphatase